MPEVADHMFGPVHRLPSPGSGRNAPLPGTSGTAAAQAVPVPFMAADVAILNLWTALGGATSFLGSQVGELGSCPDGIGYYNHFQGGSIYWSPSTGAHEVHGEIRNKWEALSWERGFLGYPVTDETGTGTSETGGRYNDFQGGTIYWSPVAGARDSQGAVRGLLHFDAGYIGFPAGIAAGGGAQITLSADGGVEFQGSMHDSGAAAYNYSVAVAVIDADNRAYTVGRTGNIAGTFESGSSDDPWSGSGPNPLVAANWRSLNAHAEARFTSDISSDLGALTNTLLAGIGAVAAVIALFVTGGSSDNKSGN